MAYTETVHSSREVQRKIDDQNRSTEPIRVAVVKRDCFTKEIFIFLDKRAELCYTEGDWQKALIVAEVIHKAYKKGLGAGEKRGKEEEYENAKGFHLAYYQE